MTFALSPMILPIPIIESLTCADFSILTSLSLQTVPFFTNVWSFRRFIDGSNGAVSPRVISLLFINSLSQEGQPCSPIFVVIRYTRTVPLFGDIAINRLGQDI